MAKWSERQCDALIGTKIQRDRERGGGGGGGESVTETEGHRQREGKNDS